MPNDLQGRTVAILIAPRGTEEPEFAQPRQALEDAGARVVAISTESGEGETVNNDLDPGGRYAIDQTFSDVDAADYDALVIPGGTVGADTLRADEDAVAFVRAFFDDAKPVAAICHAPWVVIEAGEAGGRRITSYPSLQTDLRNAGAEWVDEEVVVDESGLGPLITSRDPDDLPAFCTKLIEALA